MELSGYFAILILAVTLVGCGCGQNRAPLDQPLTIVVSGDTGGWIVPCGCASNQSGGLPRRGSYVAKLRESGDVILADVGGAPTGTSAYDLLKFEAIIRGEVAMGIAAHNLGAAEVAFGLEELLRLQERTSVTWVSANVRSREGDLVGNPLIIVSAGGRRLAIVGVMSPSFATDEVQVVEPRDAVLEALEQSADQYDALVVLAYLPEDELRQFAEMLPEADLIVGGPTGQPVQPTRVGPTLLASATNQGKFLARFELPNSGGGRWVGQIDELDGQYLDDAEQIANLRLFYGRLQQEDISANQTSFAPVLPESVPADFAVAGTESCRECHEENCEAWDDSAHAHAWKSLQDKGAHVDPACQRCHTTGYGQPGGFVSAGRSANRVAVGCESCHGPSLGHVDDPEVRTAFFSRAKHRCARCHDRENSPDFEFDEYWEKIRHGVSSDDE